MERIYTFQNEIESMLSWKCAYECISVYVGCLCALEAVWCACAYETCVCVLKTANKNSSRTHVRVISRTVFTTVLMPIKITILYFCLFFVSCSRRATKIKSTEHLLWSNTLYTRDFASMSTEIFFFYRTSVPTAYTLYIPYVHSK